MLWDRGNEPGGSARFGTGVPCLMKASGTACGHGPVQPLNACVWRCPKDRGFDILRQPVSALPGLFIRSLTHPGEPAFRRCARYGEGPKKPYGAG